MAVAMGRALLASTGQTSNAANSPTTHRTAPATKMSLPQYAQAEKPWFRVIPKETFQKDISTTEYITGSGSDSQHSTHECEEGPGTQGWTQGPLQSFSLRAS